MSMIVDDAFQVVPTGGPLGAEIRGVDLSRPLSRETAERIHAAWLEHIVLLFRGQKLTDEDLTRFALHFGEMHPAPHDQYGENAKGLHWAVELISNVVKDGKPIGALGAGEAAWHTDMSMYEIPANATILYSEEIPPVGGSTRFLNLYAAWDDLPSDLRRVVEGRTSIHDISYLATGGVRPGFEAIKDKSQAPGARHPIVRTHPGTGKKALYLGREGFGYIVGLPVEESERVLGAVWRHMTQPKFRWEHHWQVGDVLIWDNHCTAHSRGSFPSDSRRLLRRITTKSEAPF
jgi:taurine dioxygenase